MVTERNPYSVLNLQKGCTEQEIKRAYFDMVKKYDPATLKDGWNTLPNGEQVFYVSNPALGLWALKRQFAS